MENSERFIDAKNRGFLFSDAAEKIAHQNVAAVIGEVDSIPVHVPRMPMEELLKKAIAHWDEYRKTKLPEDEIAASGPRDLTLISERSLKHRLVNFIRHELTTYDEHWPQFLDKMGRGAACVRLRRRVMDEIAAVYPELADVCLGSDP